MSNDSSLLSAAGPITKKAETADRYSYREYVWALEPHVCRRCFGRIVSRNQDGRLVFACSACGLAGDDKPGAVCCCGIKLRRGGLRGSGKTMVDAGMRCHANAAVSPDFPSLYVASFQGA